MNVYITYGTIDFLSKLQQKHQNENMVLLQKVNTSALIHETNGPSLFSEPKKYVNIDQYGDLVSNSRFASIHHIPVKVEGRPLFEQLFKEHARLFEKEKGLTALRILKPLQSNEYIVLTFWEKEENFNNWKVSQSYRNAFEGKRGFLKRRNLFKPSFSTTYYVVLEEE